MHTFFQLVCFAVAPSREERSFHFSKHLGVTFVSLECMYGDLVVCAARHLEESRAVGSWTVMWSVLAGLRSQLET
jgi:hypothetical protein